MKTYADKHRGQLPNFKEGDMVLLDARNLNLQVPTKKLTDKNVGPFKIIKQHGPVNYELELPETMRIHPVFHSGLLILYKEKDYPGRVSLDRPDPEVQNEEEHYEIQEILDYKKHRGKDKYLVHWRGYSKADRTWEPLGKGLTSASEYIYEFHRDHPEVKRPRTLKQWLQRNLPEHLKDEYEPLLEKL
jgi:hypothetical protein